jgi:haloalkane dehalogenase
MCAATGQAQAAGMNATEGTNALYPFTPRRFATPEGALAYLDEGPAPGGPPRRPVLFVHGTPSWSFEWRHAIRALRAEARCVAPDHLGFGRSDKPREAPLEPAEHARRLRALVESLDLRDLTLVVHDFGGPIGLPLALDCPERIRQVVILNSWMWPHGDRPIVGRMSRLVASPVGRLLYLWMNASPRWLVPMSFGDRRKLSRAVHAEYLRPFARRADRMGPWILGRALAGADPYYRSLWERRELLRRFPLTLIWGMADPGFGPAYLARWRETFPDAALHELPGVGHFPQEEAPDEVLLALRSALRR